MHVSSTTPRGGAVSLLKLCVGYHIPGFGSGLWEYSMMKGGKVSKR